MSRSSPFLSPADAAARLGVSAKALRLYEERGLLTPGRTLAGWRAYSPADMQRAREIVALRALGFSLDQVARALEGATEGLAPALAAHQARLEAESRDLSETIARVHAMRAAIAAGHRPAMADLMRLQPARGDVTVAFDLPWPWGGERFELRGMRAITYIVGPLGSGKTKLAERIAETLPGAVFSDLDRAADGAPQAQLEADPGLRMRVTAAMNSLREDGAIASDALLAILAALEREGDGAIVFDLVEQGLDAASQLALAAHLRRRGPDARPLFVMTRSTAILDLAAVGPDAAILFCPANHSPPVLVPPCPGAPGYEALASCLAPPDVRARTAGVIAWRPPPAA